VCIYIYIYVYIYIYIYITKVEHPVLGVDPWVVNHFPAVIYVLLQAMRPIIQRRWRWATGYDCDATPCLTSAGTKMAPSCEPEYRSSGLPNRRKFILVVRTLCPHKSILVRIHGVPKFW